MVHIDKKKKIRASYKDLEKIHFTHLDMIWHLVSCNNVYRFGEDILLQEKGMGIGVKMTGEWRCC